MEYGGGQIRPQTEKYFEGFYALQTRCLKQPWKSPNTTPPTHENIINILCTGSLLAELFIRASWLCWWSCGFSLQLVDGVLQLEYRCPGGFYGTLSSWLHMNDQEWHSILVKETDTSIHLLVDSTGNDSLVLPENCRGLRPKRDLFLGGLVLLHSLPNVSQGFEGCLDAVTINGEELELLAQGKKVAGLLERQALTQCCFHSDDCSRNPCLNGGKCSQSHGKGKG